MVEQTEEAQTAAAEAPPEGDTPTEEQDINRLRSVLDRQIAAQTRRADEAETEVTRLKQLTAETEQQLSLLRSAGAVSEDMEERAQALAKDRVEFDEERKADRAELQKLNRNHLMDRLNLLYGVPMDVLEKETDPLRMENAALRWERENRTATQEPSAADRMSMATVTSRTGAPSDNEQELVNRLGRAEALTPAEMVTANKAMMEKGLLPIVKIEE